MYRTVKILSLNHIVVQRTTDVSHPSYPNHYSARQARHFKSISRETLKADKQITVFANI